MAKIDKTQYTKEEWHLIREQRRLEKSRKKIENPIAIQIGQVRHSNRTHSQLPPNNDKIAFIVGNGNSRKNINLENLKPHGTIYGCNALYREFDPDFLIAVDTKMVLELNKNKVQHKLNVWTNPNRAYHKFTGFNYFNPSKGWSSGPTALWKASDDGFNKIYILGFDYEGSGTNKELVNNIYAGTANYKRTTDKATYFGNWLKQTMTTIKNNPKVNYVRVINNNGFIPKELSKIPNLEHVYVEDFQKIFEKTTSV